MTKPYKFLAVGCWNNGVCDLNNPYDNEFGVSLVMKRLREDIEFAKNANVPYKELTILGDNYYPPKQDGEKILIVSDLESGFNCLAELGISVKIMRGNHEIDNVKNLEGCPILDNQNRIAAESKLMDMVDFEIVSNNHCLCIYLDTNIYTGDEKKKDKSKKSKGKKNKPTTMKDGGGFKECYPEKTKENIRSEVYVKINDALKKTSKKRIIFFGHVPLIECKSKKGNDLLKLCNDSESIFNDLFTMLDSEHFLNSDRTQKEIYYICADTHFYQESDIILSNGLTIHQYVIGTGGAELDDPAENDCKKESLPNDYFKLSPFIRDFKLKEVKKTNGYLRCEVTEDGFISDFIDVWDDPDEISPRHQSYFHRVINPLGSRKA